MDSPYDKATVFLGGPLDQRRNIVLISREGDHPGRADGRCEPSVDSLHVLGLERREANQRGSARDPPGESRTVRERKLTESGKTRSPVKPARESVLRVWIAWLVCILSDESG